MEANILLTGFAPFGDSKTNPSAQIACALGGETVGGARITSLVLPVVFGQDTGRVEAAIREQRPVLVLSLGLAAGTTCVDVERFAINQRVAADWQPDEPLVRNAPQAAIVEGGPDAYFATIDTERVARAICERAQVPARAHGYAGAYLCNHILYQTRHFLAQQGMDAKAGFIHLPLSCEQAIDENKTHLPSLPLDAMTRAIRAALEEALL